MPMKKYKPEQILTPLRAGVQIVQRSPAEF